MTEAPVPLLTVEEGNWGRASIRAIHGVLASAAKVLLDAYGRMPDAPLRVARWSRVPRVFYDHRPYQIRLSARDTYWCKYVYQFSHELCHVMTNFDCHRRRRHRWFDESLCELASLFVLQRLATVWIEEPPAAVGGATAYARHFASYAAETAEQYAHLRREDLPRWLRDNAASLDRSRYLRRLNGTVAVALLKPFLEEPSLWRDCRSLNRWNPATDATFAEYLDSWSACLRAAGCEPRVPLLIRKTFQLA
jgi:hypothetical protein